MPKLAPGMKHNECKTDTEVIDEKVQVINYDVYTLLVPYENRKSECMN